MELFEKHKTLDLWAAAAVFAAALAVGSWSYTAVRREVLEGRQLIRGIQKGKRRFSLLQNSACVGRLTIDVWQARRLSFLALFVELRTAMPTEAVTTKMTLEADFNSLSQLTGSVTRVMSGPIELVLESRGVAPIKLRLTLHLGPQTHKRELTLPGPFLLAPGKNGSYSLQGPPELSSHGLASQLVQSFGGTLKLDLIEAHTGAADPTCTEDGAVDISKLLDQLQSKQMQWKSSSGKASSRQSILGKPTNWRSPEGNPATADSFGRSPATTPMEGNRE